ncbi:RNA polymerase, sigma 30 subunit, SigH [Hathewaya proteolytica DSM 3090]|uniref:RNA polymerase sigma factor SigS n=1 Tax=Hathewaya proteolytica DSM 3090 TaxID=1121331 RepID=A0A1M6T623_9CLOT|nr:RNA polymerase sporulation sigma factor SigH [Hathewaya proteolytica]SHK52309.1 RNA polymerase, sigma 30 subunit, SigH [Hathewaya proteolytica DSM 3090]
MVENTNNGVVYETMTDEEVAMLARTQDKEAQNYLIEKYEPFIKIKAKTLFIIGGDKEDICQEGMIGLYKAIRDFKDNKLSSFKAFAELCITRQMITAVKTATRQKHLPLNTYVSLNKPLYDEESDRTLIDVLSSFKVTDPEELIVSKESVEDIEEKISTVLSQLEQEVFNYYLDGKSYQEIACDLNRDPKSVDNALQRVKRKLEKSFLKK